MTSEREREYHKKLAIIKKILESERMHLSADEYLEKYGTYHISDKIEKFQKGQSRIIKLLLATTIINATGIMSKELLFLLLGITAVSTILLLMRKPNK